MIVKALTIQQPWAWAIAAGHKRIENRKVRTHHRGTIAIHAGKSEAWMREGLAFLAEQGLDLVDLQTLTYGAVIAVADLVDCVAYDPALPTDPRLPTPEFAFGPWCYVLANIRPLITPFPCRGQQGWFSVEIPENSFRLQPQGRPSDAGEPAKTA